jgi:hypothetical protein
VVAALGAIFRKALSLSDIELAFFLGVLMGGSLWYVASYVASLLEERRRKKFFQIERELMGIQETEGTGEQIGKTGIDASRRQFFWDDPPEKRATVDDRTDTIDEDVERKYDEGKRA